MNNVATLCRRRDWLYRVHVVTGLAAAVWFLLMALSGVLMNHQESLGLLDAEISDRYLPDYYRADARTGATRLNILLTDLHSGRILGSRGNLVSDLIALLLVVSLASGVGSHRIKKRMQTANLKEAGPLRRRRDKLRLNESRPWREDCRMMLRNRCRALTGCRANSPR